MTKLNTTNCLIRDDPSLMFREAACARVSPLTPGGQDNERHWEQGFILGWADDLVAQSLMFLLEIKFDLR